jgi:hypothetical protein
VVIFPTSWFAAFELRRRLVQRRFERASSPECGFEPQLATSIGGSASLAIRHSANRGTPEKR